MWVDNEGEGEDMDEDVGGEEVPSPATSSVSDAIAGRNQSPSFPQIDSNPGTLVGVMGMVSDVLDLWVIIRFG